VVRIESACFSLPKAGNSKEEYEDAFSYSLAVDGGTAQHRFAVADGASESSFADIWAGLLASGYCSGKLDSKQIDKPVSQLSKVWVRQLHAKKLPWYAQEKLRSGAFSTLTGITFRLTDGPCAAFDAVAVGDSCIFQIRDDHMIACFPLGSVDEFHNRPVLISSNPANNTELKAYVKKWSGIAETGDSFLLMTDALACCMLKRYEEEPSVIQKVRALTDEDDFIDFVRTERTELYLRNDDVTLIRVNLLQGM
jgi:hypothetical protein